MVTSFPFTLLIGEVAEVAAALSHVLDRLPPASARSGRAWAQVSLGCFGRSCNQSQNCALAARGPNSWHGCAKDSWRCPKYTSLPRRPESLMRVVQRTSRLLPERAVGAAMCCQGLGTDAAQLAGLSRKDLAHRVSLKAMSRRNQLHSGGHAKWRQLPVAGRNLHLHVSCSSDGSHSRQLELQFSQVSMMLVGRMVKRGAQAAAPSCGLPAGGYLRRGNCDRLLPVALLRKLPQMLAASIATRPQEWLGTRRPTRSQSSFVLFVNRRASSELDRRLDVVSSFGLSFARRSRRPSANLHLAK
ncbi:unnamed protein product [Polarella glacialis]|uniref:Uncharacterized protein n=1 Tax=Polarella glacialis TaxID=89957 RepID=A0A813DGI1_POLGL|nr:unnamed protein product [Polarella glacialis]